MNIELLGRQAIDIIKSKWGLPKEGFVAGGSIANIIWELVSGNKAIVNDVDIFVLDSFQKNFDRSDKSSLFNYQEKETKYYEEDYGGMNFNTYTKDFYSIVESTKDDIFNIIKYKSNINDPSFIIKSFDINSTRVGYSIEKDQLYWTSEFEEFLETGELKVCNLMTPSHTAVRIAKKSKELNAKLGLFEFELIQHALSCSFVDRIKFRFKERYLEMFESNLDILETHFVIKRDNDAEGYVKYQYLEDVKLYYLMPNIKIDKNVDDVFTSNRVFNDDNIFGIHKSSDFLFYMRNIYGKDNLASIWKKVYYYFNDISYIDREVLSEDLDLLCRFSEYAPNSIENLKGMKISEQINIIKKFLDKFKEDPIIAISIIENMKIDKDIELDEQTSLLLELLVRKKIINDTRNKVGRILNNQSIEN